MKYDYAMDDAAELKKPSTASSQKRKMFVHVFDKTETTESINTKRNVINKAGKTGEQFDVENAVWKYVTEDGHVVKELEKEKWELTPFDGESQIGSYEQILKASVELATGKKKQGK